MSPRTATPSLGQRFNAWFNRGFERLPRRLRRTGRARPAPPRYACLASSASVFAVSLLHLPAARTLLLPAHRRRPVRHQRQSAFRHQPRRNRKGNRPRSKQLIRQRRLRQTICGMIVSNIGVDPGFSAIYTTNSAMHTAFVQVEPEARPSDRQLRIHGSREERACAQEMPELAAFFSSGSLVDAVLNMGLPRPSTSRSAAPNLQRQLSDRARSRAPDPPASPASPTSTFPQDLDYPALQLESTARAPANSASPRRKSCSNVITALTSNQMIAPNIWIDPQQQQQLLPERAVSRASDSKPRSTSRAIPLHGAGLKRPTRLDMVSNITRFEAPTEVDHYQIRRVLDIYVRPLGEDLGTHRQPDRQHHRPNQTARTASTSRLRGMVEGMRSSLQELRPRPHALRGAALPHPGGAVPLLHRSVHHPAGVSARPHRRPAHPLAHRHDAERHVADGRGHAGRHRDVEQHPDRRVRASSAAAKAWPSARPSPPPAASACAPS